MKKLALISAFLATSVLANDWDNPHTPFSTASNSHETMIITWRTVDNVQESCTREFKRRNFAMSYSGPIAACSFWEDNKCVMITKKNPTMHDVGHEMRHCYQGKWH